MRKIIKRKEKIDWRSIIVDYVSIYSLTILVATLIQVVIFNLQTEILLICLIKSVFTSMISIVLVLWGLKLPQVQRHPVLMALIYAITNIPYGDILIMNIYINEISILQVFGTYFLCYFIIGFFIAKYVYFAKKVLDKIIGMYTIFIPKKATKKTETNRDPEWSLFLLQNLLACNFGQIH